MEKPIECQTPTFVAEPDHLPVVDRNHGARKKGQDDRKSGKTYGPRKPYEDQA
jgi:hypothetical protein